MERMTNKRGNGIKTGYWSPNKKEELVQRLAKYENTGLTPEQVQELKEKNIPKKPIKPGMKFAPIYECPVCGSIDIYGQLFCDECGQRLDWSE